MAAKVPKMFSAMLLRKQAINRLSACGVAAEESMALRGWSDRNSLDYYNLRTEAHRVNTANCFGVRYFIQ